MIVFRNNWKDKYYYEFKLMLIFFVCSVSHLNPIQKDLANQCDLIDEDNETPNFFPLIYIQFLGIFQDSKSSIIHDVNGSNGSIFND